MRSRLFVLLLPALCACVLLGPADRSTELLEAVADLRNAGFEFAPDVAFVRDRYEVCDGIRCASVVVRDGRRTILVATEAFGSDERLRTTLLEIWERYEQPRPGSVPDLARAALRVLSDGGRVGAGSPATQKHARNVYRGLWEALPEDRRAEFPQPAGVGAKPRSR